MFNLNRSYAAVDRPIQAAALSPTMQLTKTDFFQYLNCPRSLWVLKHAPEDYPAGKFSTFLQKLTRDGYEVEGYVRQYFDGVPSRDVDFQHVFETNNGLVARADALEPDK